MQTATTDFKLKLRASTNSIPARRSVLQRIALGLWFMSLGAAGVAPAQTAGVVFKDRTADLGLVSVGEGACWADFNQDGWTDVCAGGVISQNRAGTNFAKVAEVGAGVAADFDNDGFTDFFSWSRLKLYRNDGGMRFVEFMLPQLPKSVSRGAAWGDFNNDGFTDLYQRSPSPSDKTHQGSFK